MSDGISELFVEVALWAAAKGASNFDGAGLWKGETDQWAVEFNRHDVEVDNVPPLSARLTGKNFLHIAIIGSRGGTLGGGADEDAMIRHFREAEAAERRGQA